MRGEWRDVVSERADVRPRSAKLIRQGLAQGGLRADKGRALVATLAPMPNREREIDAIPVEGCL